MTSLPELLLLGLVVFNLIFLFIVLALTDHFFSRAENFQSSSWSPPVSVIIPVKGIDDGMLDNFRALCSQDYPCSQVIFVVAEPDDPAIPVIHQVLKEHPEGDALLVVSGQKLGSNEKVNNLENGYQRAKYDYLVFTDSDVRVGQDYLRRVLAPLSDPRIGLVTCIPFSRDSQNLPAVLETIGINSNVPSMYIPTFILGKMDYGTGATLAIRRNNLEGVGGLREVANAVAEDAALGLLVRKKGYHIWLSTYVLHTIHRLDSWKGYFLHILRWNRTIRAVVPLAYTGFFLFFGVFYAFLYWMIHIRNIWAFLLFLLVSFVRTAATAYYNENIIKDPSTRGYVWLVPVRDLLIPMEWVLGFTGRTISWRGTRFRILSGARLEKIA